MLCSQYNHGSVRSVDSQAVVKSASFTTMNCCETWAMVTKPRLGVHRKSGVYLLLKLTPSTKLRPDHYDGDVDGLLMAFSFRIIFRKAWLQWFLSHFRRLKTCSTTRPHNLLRPASCVLIDIVSTASTLEPDHSAHSFKNRICIYFTNNCKFCHYNIIKIVIFSYRKYIIGSLRKYFEIGHFF